MPEATDVNELYARQIKRLPPGDRLRLLAAIARDLVLDTAAADPHERSLLELEGLGAEIWRGVDAQAYVGSLREEWDHRP